MNRKGKSTGTRWIIVFILLVGLTGLGLAATGHLSNPFGFLSQGQGRAEGKPPMGNNAGGSTRGTTSANASAPTNAQFPPNSGDRGEGGGQANINWSQIGDVAFNLWYLFATTAVIIVIQKGGGYLIRQIKQIRQRTHPAALA